MELYSCVVIVFFYWKYVKLYGLCLGSGYKYLNGYVQLQILKATQIAENCVQ